MTWELESRAALDQLLREAAILPDHTPAVELAPPAYSDEFSYTAHAYLGWWGYTPDLIDETQAAGSGG